MKRLSIGAILVLVASAIGAPTALASTPQPVIISVSVALAGNLVESTTSGTFTASGAITDSGTESGSGRFVGEGHLKTGDPNSLHSELTLVGSNGTLVIEFNALVGPLPAVTADGVGRWWVSGASGAYEGYHGEGELSLLADFSDAIAHIGPPRVELTLTGELG